MGAWAINTVFEIYSIGDAEVLAQAFNGLAMITNSGGFARMTQAAFLVGILGFGARVIMTGRFELTALLASVVMYILMFGPRAQVLVIDSYSGAVRPVANVPIGVAAPFGLVSYTGRWFAVTFETAFATVGPEAQFVGAGYLDSLDVLIRMRNLDFGTANSPQNNKESDIQRSVRNYIVTCVLYDIELKTGHADKITWEKLRNAPILWDAMKTNFPNISVTLYLPGDPPEGFPYSCSNAWLTMNVAIFTNPAFINGNLDPWMNSIFAQKLDGANTGMQRLQGSMNAINLGTRSAQEYAINSVLYNNMRKAENDYAQANSNIISSLTITQAENAREIQWVAEKTMFEKVARPVTAFIEVFLVAATPLMAFAIAAFGVAGVSTLGKFILMHFWVTLWIPTLAIANLFSITRVNRFVEYIQNATAAGQPIDALSIYGLDRITQQLQSEYATGCMMAAATPMLTLMLIYGSSQVASMLAHKMTSTQEVDKGLASPSVMSSAPVMQQASVLNGNGTVGWGVTGAAMGHVSMGSNAIQLQSSALAASQGASSQVSSMVSSRLGNSEGGRADVTYSASNGWSSTNALAQNFVSAANLARSASKADGINADEAAKMSTAYSSSVSAGLQGGVDLGKATFGFLKAGADTQKRWADQFAAQAGVSSGAAFKFLNEASKQVSQRTDVGASFSSAYSSDGRAVNSKGYTLSNTKESSDQLNAALSKSISAEQQYQEASQFNRVFGQNSTYQFNQLYESMSGALGARTKSSFNEQVDGAYSKMFGGNSATQQASLDRMMGSTDFKAAMVGRDRSEMVAAAKLAIMAPSVDGVGLLVGIQKGNGYLTGEMVGSLKSDSNAPIAASAAHVVTAGSNLETSAQPRLQAAAGVSGAASGQVDQARQSSVAVAKQANSAPSTGLDPKHMAAVSGDAAGNNTSMTQTQADNRTAGAAAVKDLTGTPMNSNSNAGSTGPSGLPVAPVSPSAARQGGALRAASSSPAASPSPAATSTGSLVLQARGIDTSPSAPASVSQPAPAPAPSSRPSSPARSRSTTSAGAPPPPAQSSPAVPTVVPSVADEPVKTTSGANTYPFENTAAYGKRALNRGQGVQPGEYVPKPEVISNPLLGSANPDVKAAAVRRAER